MNVLGKTTDGKLVVDGVFRLFDTTGLPLSDVFSNLFLNDMIPSWIHFVEDADKAGWKRSTTLLRISDALTDCKGKEYSDLIIGRLK